MPTKMLDNEAMDNPNETREDIERLSVLLLLYLEGQRRKAGTPTVRFDAVKGRFYVNDRSISIDQIRRYLKRIEDKQARHIGNLLDALEKGEITFTEWDDEFKRSIWSTHLIAAALALGSIEAARSNVPTIRRIREELLYGNAFGKEIQRAVKAKNGSRMRKKVSSWRAIKARAKSYYRQAATTYSNIEQTVREVVGVQTECRRILRAAESCKDCLHYAKLGWIPIAQQPPVGASTLICKNHCRCYLIYR